ncbi:DUF1593-domain-containing protein [Zopfia rhizophila CBS 207.26]|uniref:DUF1593-domain-containing protein n=1 Tax=Zopfia rhizophila CBS 207.26 TaxID=1314779 RepID=A0A6A6E0N5_9PEZI|nr:DUF1593-domain-containing protein [Zopfia rhizophila CBS 207.26]
MRSNTMFFPSLYALLGLMSLSFAAIDTRRTQCEPWTVDKKNRIFVLTDIANEPDDTMSLVRLLVHSDLYDVQGLVAITSIWLPNATYPNLIQELVDAYGTVQENLQTHSNSTFPTAEYLSSKISSGSTKYGMQALKALEAGSELTAGAQQLIDAVDASDEPLYVQIWGGSNTLAEALWSVNRTRPALELSTFTSKIRAYSTSDQDDTGIWIRRNFPDMRYIASRHGFNQYSPAAWSGISSLTVDVGGGDPYIVSQEWLTANIQQVGPLGKLYPDVAFIMEGDTPSLLYNIPNGLGDPEHPSWGSWGGRYMPIPLDSDAQYSDTVDYVQGVNGQTFGTNHATIWRWRDAFQHEFAARMQWTLEANGPGSNTTHPPVVVVNNSCGSSALKLNVSVGQNITLDASTTFSPDENAKLNFTWFQYKEPSTFLQSPRQVPVINFTYPSGSEGRAVEFTVPSPDKGYCVAPEDVTEFGHWGEESKCPIFHVVVAVKALDVPNPITRYRRVVL